MKGLIGIFGMAAMAAVAGCATAPEGPARSEIVTEASPCKAQRFEVYFPDGEARLTEAARQTIGMTAAQLQPCDIRKVSVIGLSDARGGVSANQSLSERRAVAVAEALAAAGWPAPVFDVEAAGESGSVTPEGSAEPMRRRTEVLVEAFPR